MAALEYEQARGKQHLALLESAQQNLSIKIRDLREKIKQLEEKRLQIENSTHDELKKELERYIVSTKIFEVSGIGQTLGKSIIRHIYKSSITDLRYASRLQGIGENKQYAINTWIRKYEREIPKLMKQDFPGKKQLLLVSAKKIFVLNEEICKLSFRRKYLEEKLTTINPWIDKLRKISKKDFINARLNNQNNLDEIDLFTNGVFGEWEPMPEWFKDVLNEVNNV